MVLSGVSYVTRSGSAILGTDAITTSGTLEWLDGDSADQYVDISIINDNETEAQESFLLTLSVSETKSVNESNSAYVLGTTIYV